MPRSIAGGEEASSFEVWLRRQRRPVYRRLLAEYEKEMEEKANAIARTFEGKREYHMQRLRELRRRLMLQSQLTGPKHFLNQAIKEQMRNSLMVLKALRKPK